MTIRLAELIEKIETLPPEIRDEIAKQILEDIGSELRWRKTLAQPQSELEILAKKVLRCQK